ncbi:MAG: threonine/serine exporter family protein [Bacilli bacterium]|nr:threonine/serine exporter family protein [Bacilli bacterium]
MKEKEVLDQISYIGFLLLRYGAEIYRVEESLTRMMNGLGYYDVEVFALPAYFTMSCTLKDGTPYCITKRSIFNRINLGKIYDLNDLVRRISDKEVQVENLQEEIFNVLEKPLNHNLILIGYIISAPSFTLFFGGGIKDMIIAVISGFILYYAILVMENLCVNSIFRTIAGSMILASISMIAYKCHFIENVDYSIIGTLMILTPGMAITNSLRDIIRGDYASGVARLAEALLIAASIAIGVGIILIIGG